MRTLSLALLHWLCDRIQLESALVLDIGITVPVAPKKTFSLPSQFQARTSRALSLSYSHEGFDYYVNGEFHHLFQMSWGGGVSPQDMPILDPSSFTSLQQLILRSPNPRWAEHLYMFPNLRDLHIDVSLDTPSPILHSLGHDSPALCPQLCTLSLGALPGKPDDDVTRDVLVAER